MASSGAPTTGLIPGIALQEGCIRVGGYPRQGHASAEGISFGLIPACVFGDLLGLCFFDKIVRVCAFFGLVARAGVFTGPVRIGFILRRLSLRCHGAGCGDRSCGDGNRARIGQARIGGLRVGVARVAPTPRFRRLIGDG